MLQVYRDTVLDLLNESEEVSIKEDESDHVVLDGLSEVRQFEVLHMQQAWTLSGAAQSKQLILQNSRPAAALLSCTLPDYLRSSWTVALMLSSGAA